MPFTELIPYLENTHFASTITSAYIQQQLGAQIVTNLQNANIADASIVIVGCGEMRGQQNNSNNNHAPNKVREHLYAMYFWHQPLKIADIGNVIQGNTVEDTRAALDFVLEFLHKAGKTVVVIGGSHDLTMSQYHAFKASQEMIDVSVIDMLIDLNEDEKLAHDNFLYPLLTDTPNYIRHFNLMAFQSYYVNPTMIETLDRLHFDCHRLGKVREDLNEMEPILRYTDLMSIDINAVRHSDAPCNHSTSPNGLHGDEVCQLTRYAGMSDKCCSFGIYGYHPEQDVDEMTARLYSQMIWYFIDGVYYKLHEADFIDKTMFNEFHVNMTGHEVLFIQSKRTQRWWMQMPNKGYVPCTRKDYLMAANNEIPERWFREMERSV
ncbi:MAG: formimidoylglutamase [Chitinophagaceae bacterium]|nr:formimidoylglutamase [Chitinophagaceae bacterium]